MRAVMDRQAMLRSVLLPVIAAVAAMVAGAGIAFGAVVSPAALQARPAADAVVLAQFQSRQLARSEAGRRLRGGDRRGRGAGRRGRGGEGAGRRGRGGEGARRGRRGRIIRGGPGGVPRARAPRHLRRWRRPPPPRYRRRWRGPRYGYFYPPYGWGPPYYYGNDCGYYRYQWRRTGSRYWRRRYYRCIDDFEDNSP